MCPRECFVLFPSNPYRRSVARPTEEEDKDESPSAVSADKTGLYLDTVSWQKKLVAINAILHVVLAAVAALVRTTIYSPVWSFKTSGACAGIRQGCRSGPCSQLRMLMAV